METIRKGELIELKNIKKHNNIISYEYELSEKLKKYINDNTLTIEYDDNVEDVPDAIMVVPFLCNILPIAWIFDATITVSEIDKSFYESIKDFKKGYMEMYPNMSFLGKLNVKNIIDCKYKGKESLCFFSGGVDAMSTLIEHINEDVITLTLWGADIKTSNENGWKNVKKFIEDNTPGIKNRFVKSTFRDIMNENQLNKVIRKYVKENWWHGFQHGIGLIGHAAPLCYKYKITNVYVASSYTKGQTGVTCASDPTIDNYLKFGSTKVHHDGYEYTRQEKVDRICKYNDTQKDKLKLRVCYSIDNGSNCCECEKCIRTIMAIKANGSDPKEYGFQPDYQKIKYIMENEIYYSKTVLRFWEDIYNKFYQQKEKFEKDNDINWFLNLNFDEENKRYKSLDRRIKRVIKRILKIN